MQQRDRNSRKRWAWDARRNLGKFHFWVLSNRIAGGILESGVFGRRFPFSSRFQRVACRTATPELIGVVGTKPVQCLFQRDVPIEVVAPVLTRAALSLALDHTLQSENDSSPRRGAHLQGFGQVEMTCDLKRRHLPGIGDSIFLSF